MAAVLSNEGGFYSAFAYLSEARRMGLAILPPDVNASDWTYSGEGDRLRMGLMQVKTIPKALGVKIMAERTRGGPYRSFHDFLQRVKPDLAHTRALVRAGCCDSVSGELTRPALLWRLYAGLEFESGPLPVPDDYPASQKRAHEIESFGFLASRHPLTLYRKPIERLQPVPASEMHRFIGSRIIMVGWLITEKAVETKHGSAMEFMTLEDGTALYDATLFPDVYRRYSHLLSTNRAYIVKGLVEASFGVVTLTVLELRSLESGADDDHSKRSDPQTWYDDPCDVPPDLPVHFSPLT
jgi:error-prone DNA polymerase